MSWSIQKTGLKAAVCKEIVECDHMPAGLKKTVLDVAAFSDLNGLAVSTSGHMGAGPVVYKFEVHPVHLVLESPPRRDPVIPAPEPAPAAALVMTAPVTDVQVAAESSAPADAASAAEVAT